MTDLKVLNSKINSSGYKKSFLAEQLGISKQALSQKLAGQHEFKSNQIQILCKYLGIAPKEMKDIFFAEKVDG